VIADNPAQVEKAKVNPKLAGWFVGQVMKATGGKANPQAVNTLVALSTREAPRRVSNPPRKPGFYRIKSSQSGH
jgi:hypothetical protein